jgi:hypothetical protein
MVPRMHQGTLAPASHSDHRQTDPNGVQVVARTPSYAEVRILCGDGHPLTIGTVRLTHDSWCWEHNDGEQSSPISATRLAAAKALADYHRAYKPQRARASMRDLLEAARCR